MLKGQTFSFSVALDLLAVDIPVKREKWVDDCYLTIRVDEEKETEKVVVVMVIAGMRKEQFWLPEQDAILADDWKIYNQE